MTTFANYRRCFWEQHFELHSVAEHGYADLATFEILKMSVGEYGDGVNGDDDDRGEHPASIHRNFDYLYSSNSNPKWVYDP